jgi:hypothetical protein
VEGPIAVSIPRASVLLGDKCHSEIYEAIDEGKLDALKDGRKTLITVESIRRYIEALPRGTVHALAPHRKATKPRTAKRRLRPIRSHRSLKSLSGGPPPTSDGAV